LQAAAGDEVCRTRVLDHIKWILIAHIDDRRADLDAVGFRTHGRQKRERRSKLPGKMMDTEIGSIRTQRLGRYGEVN
jgi:hypothetical protein